MIRYWGTLPAAVRSFIVSGLLSLQPVTTTALGVGAMFKLFDPLSFFSTMHYLGICAWGIFLGAFFAIGPFYRAKQGATAAANTVQLAGGATAVITSPPPKEPA